MGQHFFLDRRRLFELNIELNFHMSLTLRLVRDNAGQNNAKNRSSQQFDHAN